MTLVVLAPQLCRGAELRHCTETGGDDSHDGSLQLSHAPDDYVSHTARAYEAFEYDEDSGVANRRGRVYVRGTAPSPEEFQALHRALSSGTGTRSAVLRCQPHIQGLRMLSQMLVSSFPRPDSLPISTRDFDRGNFWAPRPIGSITAADTNCNRDPVMPPSADTSDGSPHPTESGAVPASTVRVGNSDNPEASVKPLPVPLRCFGQSSPTVVMFDDSAAEDVIVQLTLDGKDTAIAFRPAVFWTRSHGLSTMSLEAGTASRGIIARALSVDEHGVERHLYQPLDSVLRYPTEWDKLDHGVTDTILPSSKEHIEPLIRQALSELPSLNGQILPSSSASARAMKRPL